MIGGHFGKAGRFVFESALGWSGSEGKFQRDRYHRLEERQGAEELPFPAVGLCISISASTSRILVFGWLLGAFWQPQ